MKKIYTIAIIATALLSFASCQKEVSVSDNRQPALRTITATFENADTKTSPSISADGKKTTPLWNAGDKIKIFNSSSFEIVTLPDNFVSSSSFTFKTSLTGDLYAVYPASATTMTSCSGSIDFIIPTNQDGTFASANICVAKENSENKLVFSNATAVLEFDAGTTGVKSVRMRAANAIAGPITVSFGTNNKIDSDSYVTTNLTTRTIAAGSVTYTDSKFYVAVAPVSTGAVGFKYYKDIDNVARFDDGTGATMARNKIYTLSLPTATTDYTKDYEKIGDLKWATQNAFVSESGEKKWKGGNTNAVKVPGTIYPVVVGDYFQWGAYEDYVEEIYFTDTDTDKGLIIYNSFNNTGCGDSEDEGFDFKSATDEGECWFYVLDDEPYHGAVSPYLLESSGVWKETGYSYPPYDAFCTYTKYDNNDSGNLDYDTLQQNDDVANIIYGGNWRMPKSEEFGSLKAATYWAWDASDMGYYVFSPTSTYSANGIAEAIPSGLDKADALLFFPAAGYADTGADPESASFPGGTPYLGDAGEWGDYWSSSLDDANYTDGDEIEHHNAALGLDIYHFYDEDSEMFRYGVDTESSLNRYLGCSVRPVL